MSMTKNETLGARIKKIRLAHRLTASKFAERIGIAQSAITRIENDEANPRTETLLALYEKFQIDPFWLLTGESKNSEIENPTALKIGKIADKLSEEIRQNYLAMMERELLLHTILEEQREGILKASSE